MEHLYQKKVSTIFEQFDGSQALCHKYHLRQDQQHYWLPTAAGEQPLSVGDWIGTGVHKEHWAITDAIFQQTYQPVMQYYRFTSPYYALIAAVSEAQAYQLYAHNCVETTALSLSTIEQKLRFLEIGVADFNPAEKKLWAQQTVVHENATTLPPAFIIDVDWQHQN